MKNSDLKKKKKSLKMHIKTKETFSNMLRNCRFTFSTFIKKKKDGVEVRFEPTSILTVQSNELTLYQLS